MFNVQEELDGKILIATADPVNGKYEKLDPIVSEKIAKHKKIRMLLDLEKFERANMRAMMDDFSFALKHRRAIERMAITGSKKWEEIISKYGMFLIGLKVKYFQNKEDALLWIEER